MRVELYGCPLGVAQGNGFHYYFNENYKIDCVELINDLSSWNKGKL